MIPSIKTNLFEDFLRDIHAEKYLGTDDNMPDSFNAWLETLDVATIIDLGNRAMQWHAFNHYKKELLEAMDMEEKMVKPFPYLWSRASIEDTLFTLAMRYAEGRQENTQNINDDIGDMQYMQSAEDKHMNNHHV